MSEALIQILEAAMLVCFGVAWPIDILNTLRLRSASGKSLLFMAIVIVGYLAGIASKFLRAEVGGATLEPVTWLYGVNAALVALDLTISYYYQVWPAATSWRPTASATRRQSVINSSNCSQSSDW